MTTRARIEEFLAQKRLALVGASSSGRRFGNTLWKELTNRGYEVLAVHPRADAIAGRRCWRSLGELPEVVGGVVIVVPPGDQNDPTRNPAYYDSTYEYLTAIGFAIL